MKAIIDLLQSKTVLAGLVAAIAGVLSVLNVDIGLTPELSEKVLNGLSALGGLLAMVFRAVATKKIGGGTLE